MTRFFALDELDYLIFPSTRLCASLSTYSRVTEGVASSNAMRGNTAKTMTSNEKQFTITREILTAVARDSVRGGLMLSLESQRVFQNLLLFCFAI